MASPTMISIFRRPRSLVMLRSSLLVVGDIDGFVQKLQLYLMIGRQTRLDIRSGSK